MGAQATRDKLLRAASEVACEVGWAGATSRGIAERAGVNLALINYHFRSKDELLLVALDHSIAGLTAPPATSISELRQVLIGLADAMPSLDLGLLFQATLQAPHDARVAAAVLRYLTEFREYIAAALVGVDGSEVLAQAIAALLDGLLLHLAIDPETSVEAVLASVLDLLVGAEKRTRRL